MSMLCSATAAISCSCPRKAVHRGLAPCSPHSLLLRTPQKDACSTAVSNLTKGLHSHSFFVGRVCLRMGYPITWVAKLITEYLSRAVLKFFLTSGMPLERAAACARCPSFCECWWLSEPQLKCCNRMFTYLFQEAKKKEKNNAKGKHQQENSMFFVMLFLQGHLLLAIRLNHWNLPWSYICHWLHFPTSVIN